MINFPEFMTNRRKELAMTQVELAKDAGTTQAYISRIEAGDADVSLDLIQRIVNALRCSIEFIPMSTGGENGSITT